MIPRLSIAIIVVFSLAGLVLSPVLGALPPQSTTPQDEEVFDLIIEGPVQTINLNVITIADIVIELDDSDPVLTTIQIGDVIQVGGNVDNTRGTLVLVAQQVTISTSNIIAPIININGPVEAVNLNIVTVYGLDIQFSPDDAILTEINIGDVIAVSGNIIGGVTIVIVPVNVIIVVNVPGPEATPEVTPDPEATPEATPEAEPDDDLPVTIVIEGPVEAININIITVYGFDIEVEPDDPILTQIQIGDNIHVEGNTRYDGNTIIIVVVNITIIQVDIFVAPPSSGQGIPSGCKVTKKGKIKCTGRKRT